MSRLSNKPSWYLTILLVTGIMMLLVSPFAGWSYWSEASAIADGELSERRGVLVSAEQGKGRRGRNTISTEIKIKRPNGTPYSYDLKGSWRYQQNRDVREAAKANIGEPIILMAITGTDRIAEIETESGEVILPAEHAIRAARFTAFGMGLMFLTGLIALWAVSHELKKRSRA